MALKTNKYQIGQSATASNNFVLKTDGAGALQICRGNMGDEGNPLLTIDADGNVSRAGDTSSLATPQLGGTLAAGSSKIGLSPVGASLNIVDSEYVVPKTGRYLINAGVGLDTGANNGGNAQRAISSIYIDGTEYFRFNDQVDRYISAAGSIVVWLETGQKIGLYVYADAAGIIILGDNTTPPSHNTFLLVTYHSP